MNTTGGSLALLTSRPSKSAEVIERILGAGMIIIGKTQLSELAGFKGSNIMPGWSAVGGQTQSAYTTGDVDLTDRLLGHSSPSGSSTGSAVGVSAGYSPLAIGTDTGGSLITPSTRAALYTLRPTMNLIPQDGLIPLSHLFDTAGPMAKSPADLANLLDVMATPKGGEERKFHSHIIADDFSDFKIGFLSPEKWFFDSGLQRPVPEATAQIKKDTQAAYAKMALTAKSFNEVELVSIDAFEVNGRHSFYDIQGYDNQDQLQNAATMTMSDEEHDFLLKHARKVGRDIGIDKTLKEYDVDLVIAPADSPVNLLVSAAGMVP
ncbi:Amidase domain-containing protein [Trichoderma simmonsii]|uniref:Amidase domain-containing protein n=1 Tax=Trichoderma simmonsii TaxID=1491479 RepID=A0A8G0PJI4_9HYPO|nr:Amidase domain-containing protein [Trichoderma simmonsii]